MKTLQEKYEQLKGDIKQCGSLMVAYSGGLDSAFLLKTAVDVLGDKVVAVTADSPSIARKELEAAAYFAQTVGVQFLSLKTNEISKDKYFKNPPDRCYHCKVELYSKLYELASKQKVHFIANGTNYDDLDDYRPGLQAADEYEIISPLKDAGLTKSDIRSLAKQQGMEIWDKPASPCLASRIPYGSDVTIEKLSAIENAEATISELGIKELRVRHFGDNARIEVNKEDFGVISENEISIKEAFEKLGFNSFQVEAFKSGSLNKLL